MGRPAHHDPQDVETPINVSLAIRIVAWVRAGAEVGPSPRLAFLITDMNGQVTDI
jgi:hypothetical protein